MWKEQLFIVFFSKDKGEHKKLSFLFSMSKNKYNFLSS